MTSNIVLYIYVVQGMLRWGLKHSDSIYNLIYYCNSMNPQVRVEEQQLFSFTFFSLFFLEGRDFYLVAFVYNDLT